MARSRFSKDSAERKLFDAIIEAGQSMGVNVVFTTFLEIFATSIGAQMDPVNAKEREKRYEEIVAEMDPEVVANYGRMCMLLYLAVKEHENDPKDILGAIYHELGLNSEWNGQFFSPDDICRMMAMIGGMDQETDKEVTVINEPTCGSGAMVIGAIWAMQQKGIDYQSCTYFIAQDIDIRCVWMTYIQLCLYKVPAVVIYGNTLSLEESSRWITPYTVIPLMKLQKGTEKPKREVSA